MENNLEYLIVQLPKIKTKLKITLIKMQSSKNLIE